MARRELRRKITATVLTVTALCCLLGVCAWLLLGSNVFSDTIRIMMLVCTVVLGVATIGLLVAKVQEIRAPVSYTHLRAHETGRNLVCRLLLEKKKKKKKKQIKRCIKIAKVQTEAVTYNDSKIN